MLRIRLTSGSVLFFLNRKNSPKCISYASSFFGAPPEAFNLLHVDPTSWVHKVLAVVYSLMAVALLVQAVKRWPNSR